MKCPNCGADNIEGKRFCGDCGHKLRLSPLPAQSRRSGPRDTVIVAIAAVVVVLVVLVAILYVMFLEFEGESIETPHVTYGTSSFLSGEVITVSGITHANVVWNDVRIRLTEGSESVEWEPVTSDLNGGDQVTKLYAEKSLGALSVSLSVTDVSGDGIVSVNDSFLLMADPSFSSVAVYSAALIFEPTGVQMGAGTAFTGFVPSTPAATYSKTPISGGMRINIVSITKTDVGWDQIKVQLSDTGNNFWEWDTATADLDGGSAVTADYGSNVAGGLTVYLNVTDVAGNGVVSSSDYFGVTGAFSSGTTYAAVLIYTETGEKIGTGVTYSG